MKINKPGLDGGRQGTGGLNGLPNVNLQHTFLMQRCHQLPWLWPAGLGALKSHELLKHTLLLISCWPLLQIKLWWELLHWVCCQRHVLGLVSFSLLPPFT